MISPSAYLLPPAGDIPNHPRWPLLVYPAVVPITGADPASAFERLFEANAWPPAWRNGVHGFHHFHSNAHEVLGVYSGEVTVLFGGEGGVVITARPGDVIVLPAGTGHKKLGSRGSLGVAGAYPKGARPDLKFAPFTNLAKAQAAIAGVPLPAADPVFGPNGALFHHWREGD
jgi:uncharacterized protein YjlB